MNSRLLKSIGDAAGVAGFEDDAQEIAEKVFKKTCDKVTRDPLGNVIGFRKATKPLPKGKKITVMLAAHVDEVGLMVKHINDKGFIHFIQMGGVNSQVVQSQRVVIHGKKKVRGVIVPNTSGEKPPALSDLLIDTGLSKKELEKSISIGDVATFDSDTSVLNGKMWVGRNFDNRIGSYTLLETMNKLGDTHVDVYAVSSTQEELGLRGARVAAFGCDPDIGIAIDGSMARQAHTNEKDNLCEPGEGTGIYLIDNLTVGHRGLVKYLCDLAQKNKIPYQKNIGGGTDAKAMQQSRSGVIATTVGAPVRYMHSTVQLCHADDMDATVDLLVKFLETAHIFMSKV